MISQRGWSEDRPLLQLHIGPDVYTGKILANNDEYCWFLGRDGSLDTLRMRDVKKFSEISPQYRPWSPADLRDQLEKEFGREYEVSGSSHYLVCARRGHGRFYAQYFENLYRQFQVYFSAHGFPVREPEFPLIAIVCPSLAEFQAYCRKEGLAAPSGLMGYYLSKTNRVALFDQVASGNGTSADVHDTIIHEATHQIAFNMGIHCRLTKDPQWVVEGLATAFESESLRARIQGDRRIDRINRERYQWFLSKIANRPVETLEMMIAGDSLFQKATLDAYANAWALTFFLVETRNGDYTRYLRRIQERPTTREYSSEKRLADFRACFGDDLKQIDLELVRFVKRLGEP